MSVFDSAKTCYPATYAEAREKFVAAAHRAGAAVESYVNPSKGPNGEELATDVAWYGRADAPKVLVTISATHGVEGYSGSAAQVDWLDHGRSALPDDVAVLQIHAINPYGFAWTRRVNEDNVDLARNFVDFEATLPENPVYDALADAFLPDDITPAGLAAAEDKIRRYREQHGDYPVRVGRTQGQYKHPRGLFFGGSKPTWSRRTHEAIIAKHRLAERQAVAAVDFHTGLGQYGAGEPLFHLKHDGPEAIRARRWYGESLTEPYAGGSVSTPRVGLTSFGWSKLIGENLTFVVLEFGTYVNERIAKAGRADQWLHNQGPIDWTNPRTQEIKREIRRAFYPDTDVWRELVLFRSRQVVRQAVAGLSEAAA